MGELFLQLGGWGTTVLGVGARRLNYRYLQENSPK
jgi:hypothetical protein